MWYNTTTVMSGRFSDILTSRNHFGRGKVIYPSIELTIEASMGVSIISLARAVAWRCGVVGVVDKR